MHLMTEYLQKQKQRQKIILVIWQLFWQYQQEHNSGEIYGLRSEFRKDLVSRVHAY